MTRTLIEPETKKKPFTIALNCTLSHKHYINFIHSLNCIMELNCTYSQKIILHICVHENSDLQLNTPL